MNAQQYEEMFVAAVAVAYGVLALWVPNAIRWPRTPRRKRWFAIVGIVAGSLMAVTTALGK